MESVTITEGIANKVALPEVSTHQDDGSGIMIVSMTGYGRKSIETDAFSVMAEIRSVNHRFLEISVYLPRSFMVYEDKVKRLLAQYIRRGKVDVYISVEGAGLYNRKLQVDWHLLEQYVETMNEAKSRFSLSEELTTALFEAPDVFTVTENEGEVEHVEESLLQAVEGALEQLMEMRENEGRHLYGDFKQRLDHIELAVNRLFEDAPKVTEQYRTRLQKRIEAFLEGTIDIDEARMMNEVAVFSDKSDIAEELTRLKSHIGQFRKYLENEEEIGKKLNFLQQEMNREMNTIGAKGNDFDISVQVVEMKSELEKIKEQIQNIE
jgi:uncharacterized protein (TIGR00255 family)